MSLIAQQGWLSDWLTRWVTDDPAVRVIESPTWAWDPKIPAGLLLAALAGLWLLVALIHRSRRLDLGYRWRIVLGFLRAAILAVPILLLARPHLAAKLEQYVDGGVSLIVSGTSGLTPGRPGLDAFLGVSYTGDPDFTTHCVQADPALGLPDMAHVMY